MEYTVQQLARLSGISARTLRYYDAIGLLAPARLADNGYRLYGAAQVDQLQQILFLRELGLSLAAIKAMLTDPDFDRLAALHSHREALLQRQAQLTRLIANLDRSISALKGEITMSDQQKFEGFKQALIDDNERQYGAEIRARYGDATVEASMARVKGMSEEQWQRAEALRQEINQLLRTAMAQGDPGGATAQLACARHREWLELFWPAGTYSPAAQRGMTEMYVADERFRQYYEAGAGPGAAEFLRDAVALYAPAEER